MAADLGPLAGDAAGLIGYHRSPHGGMVHDDAIDAIIARYNIKIVGEIQLIPADVWAQLPPEVPPGIALPAPPEHRDLVSAALTGFGILLALVAYSALLLAITKGSTW